MALGNFPRVRRPSNPATPLTVAHALLLPLLVGLWLAVGPVVQPAAAATVVTAPTITPFDAWADTSCPTPDVSGTATVKRLVVHHTHRPVALERGEVVRTLRRICAGHVERGFSTIGYHYLVDPWGGVHQGRGATPGASGDAPTVQPVGAHVAGTNTGAVGIAFIGDHDEAPPTVAALDAAEALMAWLVSSIGTDPAADVEIVSSGIGSASYTGRFNAPMLAGHRDSNATACPGEHLVALLPQLRERVRALATGDVVTTRDVAIVATPAAPAAPVTPAASAAPAAPAASVTPLWPGAEAWRWFSSALTAVGG